MKLLLNCLLFIQTFLKIRTKEGLITRLILNPPQLRLYEAIKKQWEAGKPVRIIILKARQMGFSTLTEAILFWLTITAKNVETMIVAHVEEATSNLFRMSQLFYNLLPDRLKPMQKASNAQELVFDRPAKYKGKREGLNSRIRCATAGGHGVGRSATIRNLHLSEFAFWPGNKRVTLAGLMQAVPDKPGTVVIIESTANGFDEFKQLWDEAVQSQEEGGEGFIPIFFAWFEMPEYRRPVPQNFQRTQEEQELADTFGLCDEQLAWRRWCIKVNCGGSVELFHQEYPCTPDEAFVSTGHCVFDKPSLVLRRKVVQGYKWERGAFRIEKDVAGKIVDFKWEPSKDGAIRILKKPIKGVPYVLGGDTAGTGSDKFAGQVLDNRTGKQVAVLHHRYGERMFAEQMYCLGMYYNTALIGVETNYSTYPEMVLEELGYPRLYVRERYDNYLKKTVDAFGFDTNTATRPVLIDTLKDVARDSLDTITDFDTLGEMLTFVYDDKFKAAADTGEHDDLVMALGIAHRIRHQQSTKAKKSKKNPATAPWTEDMWQDYRNGSEEQKRMMRKLWGDPH